MAYPYGGPDRYPQQSSAAYGTYWPPFAGAANHRTSPAKRLFWVVLLLGLTTYLVGYAVAPQGGGTGWDVRFGALAAVVAALGLLPRQSAQTKLMAALAVMGLLEALSRLITGERNPGWAVIVIVALVALQALAAIAALVTQLRAFGAADRGPTPYDAYAYYAQAAQQYYAANNQQPQQQPVQGQGTAQAEAAASAQASQSTAERDALYAEYLSGHRSGPSRAAGSPRSGGRTQTAQPASGIGMPMTGPAEGTRPGIDSATGSPTQSSS